MKRYPFHWFPSDDYSFFVEVITGAVVFVVGLALLALIVLFVSIL